MLALDIEKNVEREFAMADMRNFVDNSGKDWPGEEEIARLRKELTDTAYGWDAAQREVERLTLSKEKIARVIEVILHQRALTKRLEGYTLETSQECAHAILCIDSARKGK